MTTLRSAARPQQRTTRSAVRTQLVVVLIAEGIVAAALTAIDQSGRWWPTLLAATTATAWWNVAHLLLRGKRPRSEIANVVVWHIVVVVGNLVRTATTADLLTAAVVATTGYLILAGLWAQARRRERKTAQSPGIGIGGIGLVAPQRHPHAVTLAHRHAGSPGGRPILLLHGLAITSTIWERTIAALHQRGVDIIAPDLLGFGDSRRLATSFTLTDQAAALTRLIRTHETGPATVVGHSWGCAVAAALAAAQPTAVNRLVLVNPPVFNEPGQAIDQLSHAPWLTRITIEDNLTAELACGLMCLMRPSMRLVAPLWRAGAPAAVARASVDHIWPAVRASVHTLLHDETLRQMLAAPTHDTTVVLARGDETASPDNVRSVLHRTVETVEVPGGHGLPLTHPRRLARLATLGWMDTEDS
ncbi:MAG: alpha/beta hydrolase, partial [Actinobacteria bacterium]|nr:alpha/beta hydrolase [Actinomycetota bacterium]